MLRKSQNPILTKTKPATAAKPRGAAIRDDFRHTRKRSAVRADLKHIHPQNRSIATKTINAKSQAVEHIGRIPKPGEAYHCLMGANYSGWDLIPATISLLPAGDHLAELRIATLGFNRQIGAALVALIDAGQVDACSMICSTYYQAHDQDVFRWLQAELNARGHAIAVARSHAKVFLMRSTGDDWIVIEGSANLRSCNNLEQFSMFNDRDLFEFHSKWMQEVLRLE